MSLPKLAARVHLHQSPPRKPGAPRAVTTARLLAYAELTIGDAFVIKGIQILQKPGARPFVVFPAQEVKSAPGRWDDLAHPCTPVAREAAVKLILEEYAKTTTVASPVPQAAAVTQQVDALVQDPPVRRQSPVPPYLHDEYARRKRMAAQALERAGVNLDEQTVTLAGPLEHVQAVLTYKGYLNLAAHFKVQIPPTWQQRLAGAGHVPLDVAFIESMVLTARANEQVVDDLWERWLEYERTCAGYDQSPTFREFCSWNKLAGAGPLA